MREVPTIPDPEPGWEEAVRYQGEKRNPALQISLWNRADGFYRLAFLAVRLEDVAARFRLVIERSWEDLGPVEVATFRINRIDFAVSRLGGDSTDAPEPAELWAKNVPPESVDEVLGVFFQALGVDPEGILIRNEPEDD